MVKLLLSSVYTEYVVCTHHIEEYYQKSNFFQEYTSKYFLKSKVHKVSFIKLFFMFKKFLKNRI